MTDVIPNFGAVSELQHMRKSIGSPSLRRRSHLQNHRRAAGPRDEERNDDEAERSLLLASDRAPASTPSCSSTRRSSRETVSSTSSPQREHIQGCLKLYAENKITKDNAWNLQLIDFMTSMLRKHDSRMENLQTASAVVDASARIYSFRVDAVHHDVLKMAGGLTKAAQSKRGKKDDDGPATEGDGPEGDGVPAQQRKRKKKKGAIVTNPETLNGDLEINECIDPFFDRLASSVGDVTASNRAFSATLPINDKTFALILAMDEPFLTPPCDQSVSPIDLSIKTALPLKLLYTFTKDDHICEPFDGFSITNWDPDSENRDDNRINQWVDENRLNLSQQAVAFDVNAEVEPIPQDEVFNDLLDDEPLAGIESEEEADVAVAALVARIPCAAPPRLTEMRPQGSADARLEYSYSGAIESAWAGPAHWRLNNNRASKLAEKTQTIAGRPTIEPAKKPARTKRQLDFTGAGLRFDSRGEPTGEYEPTQPNKITISRKTLATGHTWSDRNFKTAVDRGLEETHFKKLFLKSSVILLTKREIEQRRQAASRALQAEEPVRLADNAEYDYNNENDSSYCPNIPPDGEEWGNEDGQAAGEPHDQLKSTEESEGLGEMLEPPTKVAKIFIPYACRAKKVDMKQLKHCTWKLLTETNKEDAENQLVTIDKTTFNTIYHKLPHKLSSNMRDSLSTSLALLSVLHLANEKGLVLQKHDDNKDFSIVGLL